MTLADLELDLDYRSDDVDLATELFDPLLSLSTTYDRAAGYFTSRGLASVSRGLATFIAGGGRMRLVTSPVLSQDDIVAISKGHEARTDVLERILLEEISRWNTPNELDEIALLSWLISTERLTIKIAVPASDARPGIYHEKMGLFSDDDFTIAVSGSANETQGGLVDNFESLEVFTSARDPHRVKRKREHFERLWSNETPTLDVVSFPDAAMRALLVKANPARTTIPLPRTVTTGIELRWYQQEAVDAWISNDRRGIFEMATGTGKTITALSAVRDLADTSDHLVVVVLAPYIHLVDQWVAEIRRWGFDPVTMHGSSKEWLPNAIDAVDHVSAGVTKTAVLVTTHTASALAPYRELLDRLPLADTLIIADEMHHLGSDTYSRTLPQARYRLGLSATPHRWNDESGTRTILEYFGGVVYEFGLGEAIEAGCLTPYRYEPVLVELTDDELAEYRLVVSQLVDELDREDGKTDRARVAMLMNERSELLNTAGGKLAHLRAAMVADSPDKTLIYCAGGEQLGAVQNLAWDLGVTSQRFTANESAKERIEILKGFSEGEIPCLAAIRCLDEGVDVPSTREAYLLASSGNPRQFIQRRGRVLRLADGKSGARIVDYIVIPEPEHPREEEILAREIARVVEFADTATNRAQALEPLSDLIVRYGVANR